MKKVRQSDTEPELAVRRLLHSIGGRYRTTVADLPGKPDIANKTRSKAIFVHGCFWHYHDACGHGQIPTRNRDFWKDKLLANRRRDQRKVEALEDLGFRVLVIWECELEEPTQLAARLKEFWFDDDE